MGRRVDNVFVERLACIVKYEEVYLFTINEWNRWPHSLGEHFRHCSGIDDHYIGIHHGLSSIHWNQEF